VPAPCQASAKTAAQARFPALISRDLGNAAAHKSPEQHHTTHKVFEWLRNNLGLIRAEVEDFALLWTSKLSGTQMPERVASSSLIWSLIRRAGPRRPLGGPALSTIREFPVRPGSSCSGCRGTQSRIPPKWGRRRFKVAGGRPVVGRHGCPASVSRALTSHNQDGRTRFPRS
jgi:hypothetical protein